MNLLQPETRECQRGDDDPAVLFHRPHPWRHPSLNDRAGPDVRHGKSPSVIDRIPRVRDSLRYGVDSAFRNSFEMVGRTDRERRREKGDRRAGSAELDDRRLLLNPVSRTSDSLEMFGLSTDFPTADLGTRASGDA